MHDHCVKSVNIWSFSGPYFQALGLNTERYSKSFRIQSKCGKIWTRKTPNKDTFHSVEIFEMKVLIKKYFLLSQPIKSRIARNNPDFSSCFSWAHDRKKVQPRQCLLVQSEQRKYQNNMWNLFKVNNKDSRTTSLTFFWCLYC